MAHWLNKTLFYFSVVGFVFSQVHRKSRKNEQQSVNVLVNILTIKWNNPPSIFGTVQTWRIWSWSASSLEPGLTVHTLYWWQRFNTFSSSGIMVNVKYMFKTLLVTLNLTKSGAITHKNQNHTWRDFYARFYNLFPLSNIYSPMNSNKLLGA